MTTEKNIVLSYLPIDVGFDLKRHDMPICLPSGESFTVRYLDRDSAERETTGTRAEVAAALEAAGYQVAPEEAPLADDMVVTILSLAESGDSPFATEAAAAMREITNASTAGGLYLLSAEQRAAHAALALKIKAAPPPAKAMSKTHSRLTTTERMSNTGYHANGKPNWWARANDAFLDIPRVRGDAYLNCIVDVPPGTVVSCGAGKGTRKTVRETVTTTEIEEGVILPEDAEDAIIAEQRRAMLRGAANVALLRYVAKVEAAIEAGEETPAAAVMMAEEAAAELRDRGFLMTFPRPRG